MDPRNGMDTPSGAARSSLGQPSALPASRIPIQQTWLTTDAASAAAILLLLLAFVVWPVLRVLATSLAGPAALTLRNYAAFFSSSRPLRTPVNRLSASAASTATTVAG